jgi:hypothetical protein
MFARLGFSVAVHLDPDILLIDEVLSVGDQAFQQKCNERMMRLRKTGITIVFVSHSLEAVTRTCSKAVWLDHGRVLASGDVQHVANTYYKHVLQHSSPHAAADNDDSRFGSGEARVVRVELLDDAGAPLSVALTNDAVIVRMHYHARERIERPVFGLGMHDTLNGIHLAGPNNSLAEFDIDHIHGDGYVDYRIARLPLMPGEYTLRTAIYDSTITQQYDAWLDCARLKVAPGGTNERYGLIAFEGGWSHVPGAGAAHGAHGDQMKNGRQAVGATP